MALSADLDRRLSELMNEAQQGRKESYAALLQEAAALLRQFIANRIDTRESAEDLVQEVLISIHSSRHTYRIEKPFAPWMYAIARHRIADYWRRQARRIACGPLEDEFRGEEQRVVQTDTNGVGTKVRDVLLELPEKQRRIVQLLKLEGLSIKETAIEMSMSEAAVKVAAHRAYEKLRNQCSEMTDGDK